MERGASSTVERARDAEPELYSRAPEHRTTAGCLLRYSIRRRRLASTGIREVKAGKLVQFCEIRHGRSLDIQRRLPNLL